jgi:hypothetical protein
MPGDSRNTHALEDRIAQAEAQCAQAHDWFAQGHHSVFEKGMVSTAQSLPFGRAGQVMETKASWRPLTPCPRIRVGRSGVARIMGVDSERFRRMALFILWLVARHCMRLWLTAPASTGAETLRPIAARGDLQRAVQSPRRHHHHDGARTKENTRSCDSP